MFIKKKLIIFICFFVFQNLHANLDLSSKKRMAADLETIRNEFEVNYAPTKWKKQYLNWDLNREIEEAREKILSSANRSLKDYQQILRDLFNSAQDMHVGINFYSTEFAVLPFLVQGVDKRYFVVWLDEEWANTYGVSLKAGDEIISFDGKPIDEIVQDIKKSAFGKCEGLSYSRMSEMQLTMREGSYLRQVPHGTVYVEYKKKETGKHGNFYVDWYYVSEEITNDYQFLKSSKTKELPLGKHSFFKKPRVLPFYQRLPREIQSTSYEGKLLGATKSQFPPLGKIIWKSNSQTFDAYICTIKNGKNVGYIRIPTFSGGEDEINEFRGLITLMQVRTHALVLDVMNNPGGYAFYTYAIASMLTDKPLFNLSEKLSITQEDVYFALQDTEILDAVTTDKEAVDVLGSEICGYPVSLYVAKGIRSHAKFIIDQYKKGNFNTDYTYLEGMEYIYPHPNAKYTKPILVLANSLSISCADLLPALLQDNKRAQILGTPTAGAGGYVLLRKYSNRFGVADFTLTGSLMVRLDGKPLENLGVAPDIPYSFTIRDYMHDFTDFISLVNKHLNELTLIKYK